MTFGVHYETYADLEVYNDPSDEPRIIEVEVVLICTDPGSPPSGRDEFYDPGEAPLWEVDTVKLHTGETPPIRLTEHQFAALFPRGMEILKDAFESAQADGIVQYEDD